MPNPSSSSCLIQPREWSGTWCWHSLLAHILLLTVCKESTSIPERELQQELSAACSISYLHFNFQLVIRFWTIGVLPTSNVLLATGVSQNQYLVWSLVTGGRSFKQSVGCSCARMNTRHCFLSNTSPARNSQTWNICLPNGGKLENSLTESLNTVNNDIADNICQNYNKSASFDNFYQPLETRNNNTL